MRYQKSERPTVLGPKTHIIQNVVLINFYCNYHNLLNLTN